MIDPDQTSMLSASARRTRKRLLLGAALSCLVGVAQAQAQASVAAATDPAISVGEVIVTAQRREERLRDVPITMTVRSGEALTAAGVDTIRDLHVVTPGLRIDRNGVSVQPSIRGITALDGNPGNDANVSIYVDGVYRPNPAANNFDFPDVDRIEVLKGPQGTLFGRNATGGAIRIQTIRPSFSPSGQATVGYGSFNDVLAKGYVTGPVLGDQVAALLSGYYEKNDGYLKDDTRGGAHTGRLRSVLLRAKLLFAPTDGVRFVLGAEKMHRRDGSLSGQPFLGNTATRGTPGVIIPTEPWHIANNGDPHVTADQSVLSLTGDVDVGFATLNTISAYINSKVYSPVEDDYTNIDRSLFFTHARQKTLSQEVNLTSKAEGPLKWVVGVFYYNDDANYDPLAIASPGSTFNIYGRQRTAAYAAFGEATYAFTDRFSAIVGVRYSHEKRRLNGSFGSGLGPAVAEKTFSSTTPRVSLLYKATETTNLYATYSQGFKSGGFTASSLNPTGFNPEKVRGLEAGVKSDPSRLVSVNAAAFYYDYRDQQVQAAVQVSPGVTVGTTTNAARSRIYGVEFDGVVRPFEGFTLTGEVSWLHARYRSFPSAFVQVPKTVGGVVCFCGNVGVQMDVSGNRLVRAPDLTASLTAEYRLSTSAGDWTVSGTAYHSAKFFFTPDNRVHQPAYTTYSARGTFAPKGQRWQVSVWGRNLSNEVVFQGASILPDADGVLFAPPRTYGVELQVKF
jgi:iron complex outermembrane receptor protein